MRIAATADLHFTPQRFAALHEQLNKVRDEADVFVVAGDLTNYGQPDEMEPLLNAFVRLRVPVIAVLGNHDYECDKQDELMRMMAAGGVKVLDGSTYQRDGVGFAGTKGFVGGFGRGLLTAFGEPEVKTFILRSRRRWRARRGRFIRFWAVRDWRRWWIGTGRIWFSTGMRIMESSMARLRGGFRCTMSRSLCWRRRIRRWCIGYLTFRPTARIPQRLKPRLE
jgi:calcineurin-like phosphoesterase family protein